MNLVAPSLRRLLLLAALAVAALLLMPHHAKAAAIVDQDQSSYCGCFGSVDNDISWAQTFTAGVTGAIDHVEVPIWYQPSWASAAIPAEPLVVDIQSTLPDGSPSGTVLASTSVPLPELTQYCCSVPFAPVSFAVKPHQVAGTQYAIVLHTDAYCPNPYSSWDTRSACYIGWLATTGYFDPARPGWIDYGDATGWHSIGTAVMAFRTYVVTDSTPPVITAPSSVTADATSAAGATVAYSVSATDETDGAVAATCTPASGSAFAIGTTTVTCSATDAAGNAAAVSFTVTVRGAAEQLASLRTAVTGAGPGKSLAAKVAAVQAAVAGGDRLVACSALRSLALELRAQSGKSISAATASSLLADVARIGAVLGC